MVDQAVCTATSGRLPSSLSARVFVAELDGGKPLAITRGHAAQFWHWLGTFFSGSRFVFLGGLGALMGYRFSFRQLVHLMTRTSAHALRTSLLLFWMEETQDFPSMRTESQNLQMACFVVWLRRILALQETARMSEASRRARPLTQG